MCLVSSVGLVLSHTSQMSQQVHAVLGNVAHLATTVTALNHTVTSLLPVYTKVKQLHSYVVQFRTPVFSAVPVTAPALPAP
jgi:hypothetical protein